MAAAREIADATGIPRSYLSKVLGTLGQGGLLEARRGIGGGFLLVRDPQEITALEVVRMVEPGPVSPGSPPVPPPDVSVCGVRRLLSGATERFERLLESTTIADLAACAGQEACAGVTSLRREIDD